MRVAQKFILMGVAGLLAAAPWALAQTQSAAGSAFAVASVRMTPPDSSDAITSSLTPPGASPFVARNMTLKILIQLAYGIDANKIVGIPEWMNSQGYDITAKAEGGAGLSYQQLQAPLQQLLAERFHLAVHRDSKEMNGFALVVAKGGPKLEATKGVDGTPTMTRSEVRMQNMTLATFALLLGRPVDRPVVDRTGLTGKYDIDLKFAPINATDSQLPSIFTALQEQLGLKLEAEKQPVETLVIDHVDKVPTEN